MERQLRERALATASENPERYLRRLRDKHAGLVRAADASARSRRVGLPLGASATLVGAGLGAVTATGSVAALAGPVGWIAAGVLGLIGLFTLSSTATAGRREQRAREHLKRLTVSHGGRALEVDALLQRMAVARESMAADYARFEARLMRVADPRHQTRAADNADLLSQLRGRHLAFVRRLDEAREKAQTLRTRLVQAAIAEEVDAKLAYAQTEVVAHDDERHRAAFALGDSREELERLTRETDALEELERSFALSA